MFAIVDSLKSDRIAGLSLLGGDPLWQDIKGMCQLIALCKEVHSLGKTVWIWSGFVWEKIFKQPKPYFKDCTRMLRQEIIRNCDVWVDGQFELSKRDLRLQWCGSSNQRVIDVKKSLEAEEIILYKSEEIWLK